MKTNVPIDLTDDQREHVANLLDGKVSKRKVSRLQVNEITALFWRRLLECNVGDYPDGGEQLVDGVLEDINRGGWSLIGEPPSPV